MVAFVVLDLVSSVPAERLAGKNISKITYFWCRVGIYLIFINPLDL